MLFIFYNSCFRRFSSIVAISSCCLCSFSQPAICLEIECKEFAIDIATNISIEDSEYFIEKFDVLEEFFKISLDPLEESRRFLQDFIAELNGLYGLNLTIDQACLLVRENVSNFQLPLEVKNILLKTIDLLQSNSIESINSVKIDSNIDRVNFTNPIMGILPKWFHKKSHKNSKKNSTKTVNNPVLQIDTTNIELPSEIYIGAVEIFAGVLVCTLGLVYFPAVGMGLGVMGDGARRVFSGLTDLGNERREQLKPFLQ